VGGRPTLVTCFRVGAVVQAGGETKGIGRRDWPIVSCRAEPPLVRCDGSQASGISRLSVSKVIAAAGTAVGQDQTVLRRRGQRRWRSRKSSVARLKVSGSSCSPACDRWSKTTRSHPRILLVIRSANRGEQTRS